MQHLTKVDKQNLCDDYLNGSTIKELYTKYHIGDRRVRQILIDNNISIKNTHIKTKSTDDYIEKCNARFASRDGYHYVAIAKNDHSVKYEDVLNKSGTLTSYIKNVLCIEIPSLFKRKKYFHENGVQWYEQYFDIVEEKNESLPLKKCPYCNWSTIDVENKSGMFETHLLKDHGITKFEYLKEFPNDKSFFEIANKTLNRKMENDKTKYVVCAICGEKFARLDWRHLAKHGITKEEYIKLYGNSTVSNELHNTLSKNAIETNKNMIPKYTSKPECEIKEYIESFGINCLSNNRSVLNGKELDIYIPSLNCAIEYNGNFWHHDGIIDKNKHLEKTELCKKNNIQLLQIFEDEYFEHKDIVYNKIRHILGLSNDVKHIMGRKCTIKTISNEISKEFLNKYHIQGFVSSTVYFGAFYGDELIAVMTFKKTDKSGLKWELNRFASNYNYICQGVGGKLFKHFVNKYNPNEIKSFADRRWTVNEDSNIYIKLGFNFECYTKPDYTYYSTKLNRYKRFHKFNFRKNILHKKYNLPLSMTEEEMTKHLGFNKIWNCGLIKYVWYKK